MVLPIKELLGVLLWEAYREFDISVESEVERCRQEDINGAVENEFTSDQQEILEEVFQLTSEIAANKGEFLYRKGLRDCVTLLRVLEIIH